MKYSFRVSYTGIIEFHRALLPNLIQTESMVWPENEPRAKIKRKSIFEGGKKIMKTSRELFRPNRGYWCAYKVEHLSKFSEIYK